MIHRAQPAQVVNLKGCEVTPDVNISQNKYGIKLEVPSNEGMTEMYIRCDDVSFLGNDSYFFGVFSVENRKVLTDNFLKLFFLYKFKEKQYAKWMACCKLAAKGRSLADSSYDSEVRTILEFLQMQKPVEGRPVINPSNVDINPEHYVSPRYLRKLKGKVKSIRIASQKHIYDRFT